MPAGSFDHSFEFLDHQTGSMACLPTLVQAEQCGCSSEILRYLRPRVPIFELWLPHDTRFFLEVAFYGLH